MVPTGDFLKELNGRPRGQNEYLAIASNYEPTDRQLKSYFRDVVTDQLFDGGPNDSMVRIDSVCGSSDKGAFATVDEQLAARRDEGHRARPLLRDARK